MHKVLLGTPPLGGCCSLLTVYQQWYLHCETLVTVDKKERLGRLFVTELHPVGGCSDD